MSELGGGEKIVEGREDRNVEIVGKVPGKRSRTDDLQPRFVSPWRNLRTLMVGSSGGDSEQTEANAGRKSMLRRA